MEKLNVVIIDDELNAIKSLQYELRQFENQVEVVHTFNDVNAAVDYLSTQPVDLVFLDIEMPGKNGLDFLKDFKTRNFYVVFTTAYSQYAVNAFKMDATDYLLKPIDGEDLGKAIQKVEKALYKDQIEEKLMSALQRLNQFDSRHRKVKFSLDGKIIFLEPDDILYAESDGNYTYIFLQNGEKMLLTLKLKYVEEELPDSRFYRIHNSYIINLSKVIAFHKNDGQVELKGKIFIPVSRQKRSDILNKL